MTTGMTTADVHGWLDAVKAKGLATTDVDAGMLIGKSPDTVVRMKQRGADYVTGLACAAVLNGIDAFRVPGRAKAPQKKAAAKVNGKPVATTKPVAKKVSGKGGKPVPVKKAKKLPVKKGSSKR